MTTIKDNDFLALNKWEKQSNYMGTDCSDYYIVIAKTRDSGLLEISNYESIKAYLFDKYGKDLFKIVTFNHWGVGWIQAILIHENASGSILHEIDEIKCALSEYPVFNDTDYFEREHNAMLELWEHASLSERIDICKQANESIFAARKSLQQIFDYYDNLYDYIQSIAVE